MTEFDWKRLSEPAAVIQALQAHRLLPVAGLLVERGLLRADLLPLAARLVQKQVVDWQRRVRLEDEVLRALAASGIDFLVLKGALLARTVYPSPESRLRTDADLLVAAERVDQACSAMRDIGFAPGYEVHGGAPMTQAQWIRRGDEPVHGIDLHWDLFNLPLLKERFSFEALLARSVRVPSGGGSILGLCAEDALLHACAHYFGHHRDEFRPDQWLLDMDLLWRSLRDGSTDRLSEAALSMGIGSLLAAGMRLSAERFGTPVDPAWIARLEQASRAEPARRLTWPTRFKALEIFRSAFEEQGLMAGIRNLRGTFFPPAEYMFRKYPGSRRWSLPWLYLRRLVEGAKK